MIPTVDLVVLTRHAGPLPSEVETGIRGQQGVEIVLHRVVGVERPGDRCRWDAIARARNEGKSLGSSSWLMFLDDDVVLEPSCVSTLVGELSRRPAYGALAADYLGQSRQGEIARHVSMGATLFRREAIQPIRFTWRDKRCECQCCCDDLRRLHWGIDYCSAACARHLINGEVCTMTRASAAVSCDSKVAAVSRRILVAFNRRHLQPFCERFLPTLRTTGNKETVLALGIGLYPSERARLLRVPGVTPFFRHDDGRKVARQRLQGFQDVLRTLPPATLVAYWDAGDVVFQATVQPLWEQVRLHPGKLHVVREPAGHPESPTIMRWTRGIVDVSMRRKVRRLLYPSPWLNGGFVAGSAGALLKYFRTVANWYDSPRLAGSSNRGDQLALNVYCHSCPEAWHEVPESWNYCLCRRDLRTVYRREDGRYVDSRGTPIYVVHGNGGKLAAVSFRRIRV